MLEGLQTPRGVSRRLPEGLRGPVNSIHPAVISPVMPHCGPHVRPWEMAVGVGHNGLS